MMPGGPWFDLTIALALIFGTAAGLLAVLLWEVLRRSPLGLTLLGLAMALVVFIVYHVLVLLGPREGTVTTLVRSLMYTGVGGVVWLMVWIQHRLRTEATGETNPS